MWKYKDNYGTPGWKKFSGFGNTLASLKGYLGGAKYLPLKIIGHNHYRTANDAYDFRFKGVLSDECCPNLNMEAPGFSLDELEQARKMIDGLS